MNTHTAWQRRTPAAPYNRCSPNLEVLRRHLVDQAGGQFLGCYNRRPIIGGTSWSSHAFGAAIDWGYGERHNGPGRPAMLAVVLPWLIENHAALGVQQIHDYGGNRYWQNWRGWINRPPGRGPSDALHIETHELMWSDDETIPNRGVPMLVLEREPAPNWPGKSLRIDSKGVSVERVQRRLNELGYPCGRPDGWFGPRTDRAVRNFQRDHAPPVDGIVGRITWSALFPK